MNKHVLVRTLLAVAAVGAFLGCSTANQAQPKINPTTGVHPATWVATDHWSEYLKNPASCSPCHGSATDPTQAGGTSNVTCFQCHHVNGPQHPGNWADPAQHGAAAKAAYDPTQFSMKGFASCTPCHGSDYNSPVASTPVGFTPSCYACHKNSPHASAPWGYTGQAVPPVSDHSTTDLSNLPECFKCHYYGSAINLALALPAGLNVNPATTGTPGCYNGTMCHGTK